MEVQIYLTDADYPRRNWPLPRSYYPQPDLTLTFEVDVVGLEVAPVPPEASFVMPDYGELQRLLEGPVAAAVRTALS